MHPACGRSLLHSKYRGDAVRLHGGRRSHMRQTSTQPQLRYCKKYPRPNTDIKHTGCSRNRSIHFRTKLGSLISRMYSRLHVWLFLVLAVTRRRSNPRSSFFAVRPLDVHPGTCVPCALEIATRLPLSIFDRTPSPIRRVIVMIP